MSLAERRWLRLFTLTLLFFAQGVPWGFLAITLPAYLSGLNFDAGRIGLLIAMSYWPFVFKWVFGPVIDSYTLPRFGRRRPWIVLSQTMMAVTAAGLLLVGDPASDFSLLVVLVLAHTVFNAMQNVAVDALAIDLLPENERGRANGLMYGAKYAGGALGAAGMGQVIAWWGFHTAIAIQVVILFAIAIVPVLVRERTGEPPPHTPPREVARTLVRVFRLRSPSLCALLMLLALISVGLLSVIAPVLFMQDLKWDQADYSVLAGGPGLLVGALGSSITGPLADKLGHRRLVAIATIVMGSVWVVFALGKAWWTTNWFCYALIALEPFTQGILIVSLWTLCMDNSVPKTAATQFAAYTSLSNLSTIVGAQLVAGRIGAVLDYQGVYLFAGLLQIAMVALIPLIDPHQVRRELATS